MKAGGDRRRTFAALVMGHAVLDWNGSFWPIFKYLAGMDVGLAGIMATVPSFLGSLLQPVFGHLADRGRFGANRSRGRGFIVGGVALTLFMTLLGPLALSRSALGATATVSLMVAVLALTRIGQSMFHPPAATQAGDMLRGRRSTLMSAFVAFGWLGVAFSQPVFSWAYLSTGGHTEILLVPGLLGLALIWAWYRPAESGPGRVPMKQAVEVRPSRIPWGRIGPLFAVLALTDFLGIAWSYLMPEFTEQKGCPGWIVRGGGMFAFTFGTIGMMIPAGMLADRFGRDRLFAATLAVSLALYAGLVTIPPGNPWSVLVLLFLFGGMTGVANPLGVAYGQELVPDRASTVTGFMMGWAWAVGGLGSAVAGAIARIPSQGAVGAMRWLMPVNVVALVLAVAFLSATKTRRGITGRAG